MTTKQILGPNQRKWIDALRSGEYSQTKGCLENLHGNCCLGVGGVVFELERKNFEGTIIFDGEATLAPKSLIEILGLENGKGTFDDVEMKGRFTSLVDANDEGETFNEIATFCEANPEAVFKEAR